MCSLVQVRHSMRRRIVLAGTGVVALSACRARDADAKIPKTSLKELKALLLLPPWVVSTKWEWASLPEHQEDGVPGRTDYLALVALLTPSSADAIDLGDAPPGTRPAPIPALFIRPRLPANARKALATFGQEATRLSNLSPWVIQHAKGAWGMATNDGVLVYVDHLSPA